MIAQCCAGGGPSRRLARRLYGAAASILPGALLVLLPKCPLCLAAWLSVATGIAVPAAAVARVRGLIVVFWAAAVALAATKIVRASLGFGRRKRLPHLGGALTEMSRVQNRRLLPRADC
jgi:hypothetical protein